MQSPLSRPRHRLGIYFCFGEKKPLKVLGYINDDSDSIGKVHFGILYLLEINGTVQLKSPEFKKGKLLHINELEKICSSQNYEIENWSKIALEPLKKYLE